MSGLEDIGEPETAALAQTAAAPTLEDVVEPEVKENAAAFAKILQKESGNRQFNKDGSPVVSAKGAVGAAQILPSTGPEAAQAAGEPWDQNRLYTDENYNRKLGEAYYNKLVRQFNDPAIAAAAYNAGPSAVARAIEQAKAKGGKYLDYLPTETQQYVAGLGEGEQAAAPALEHLTTGQALEKGIENLPSSTGHALAGIYETFRHPWDNLAIPLKNIAVGLDSKIRGYAGEKQDPQEKAKDEALVNALADQYKGDYSTYEGFKNKFANDPASVLLDLSAVATAGEGALAGASRVASKLGAKNIAGALSKGQKIASAATASPLAAKPVQAVNTAGDFTPAVDQAISKVSGLNGADFGPAAKQAVADVIGEKGVSDASAREAVLRSVDPDMRIPTPIVTGEAPLADAKEAVADSVAKNNETIANRAAAISGASAPSISDLGAALDEAHTSSYNAAQGLYRDIRSLPGSFGPKMPTAGLWSEMGKNLKASGLPSTPELITDPAAKLPQASEAVKYLHDALWNGKTPLGQGLTAPSIQYIRTTLNEFLNDADGRDIKAMRDIIDAFDSHISKSAAAGAFRDAAGNPVAGLDTKIKAANAAYSKHMNTFETPNGSNNTLVNAVRKLKSEQQRAPNGDLLPSGNADLYAAAQQQVGRDLLDPVKGGNMHSQLVSNAPASAPAVNAYVRQSLLANDGAKLTPHKNTHALLTSPNSVAARAFTPAELGEAKRLHAAHAINNAKPTLPAQTHSLLSHMFGKAGRHLLAGAIGYHLGEIPGLLVGTGLEGLIERGVAKKAAAKAMKGAPSVKSKLRPALSALVSPKTLAAANVLDAARQHRASGGRVDPDKVDALVKRLMDSAKRAKKETDAKTSRILGVPDESVVKALSVAQQAI